MRASTYAEAGVDVAKVRAIQKSITALIKATRTKDALPVFGHYAGLMKVGKETVALHTDGVGTKVLVAQFMKKYDTIGIDCVAMNVNDVVCVGAKPIALVDYIALEKEDGGLVHELVKGLVRGARESGTAIVGGETAVMGDVVKGLPGRTGFDLAATVLGRVDGRPITGLHMKPGDAVVGLASSGIHSNGLTMARKVLALEEWGGELLRPTRIYVKPVLQMISECSVGGLAHITGGAFSKLSRICKRAGILLNEMPEPPRIFQTIAEESGAGVREMYRTFNMGVGMCVVVPERDVHRAVAIAKKSGIPAKRIGVVTKAKGIILEKDGERVRLG